MRKIDGNAATRMICAQEYERELKHTPIIALIAHAIKGADAERAAARMDDYLSKPIGLEKLGSLLEGRPESSNDLGAENKNRTHEGESTHAEALIDWQTLLNSVGDDEELARELATLFIGSGLNTTNQIIPSLEKGDDAQLGKKVHEIKCASASLQAVNAAATERWEVAAHPGSQTQMQSLVR